MLKTFNMRNASLTNEDRIQGLLSSGKDADRLLSKKELLEKLPVSDYTLGVWLKSGKIPYIKLPGARRLLFDWPTVKAALLKCSKGGVR